MAQKWIIKKKNGSKGRSSRGRGERTEQNGTFQLHARREEILRNEKLGKRGMLRCPNCGAIYFEKHWHSPSVLASVPKRALLESWICDECRVRAMAKNGAVLNFGGELVIEGKFGAEEKQEILALVRNVGARAAKRDPEERIIKISERGGTIRVSTTENQLAVSIGKQLDRARKGGTLAITWSHEDKPVRVRWTKGAV